VEITKEDLFDISAEASHRLNQNIRDAFNQGNLENYLMAIGMEDLIPKKDNRFYDSDPEGKLIIFGDSQIRKKDVFGCLKDLGIPKTRVELYFGYNELVKYPFQRLQYKYEYRLILFGPLPHSTSGKDNFSSIINKLEETDGYTKVVRLTDGHALKITKTNLKNAVREEIRNGYLVI